MSHFVSTPIDFYPVNFRDVSEGYGLRLPQGNADIEKMYVPENNMRLLMDNKERALKIQ